MGSKIVVNERYTWRAPEWVLRNLLADASLAITSAYARERGLEYREAYDKAWPLEAHLESALDHSTVSLDMSGLSGPDIRILYRAIAAALESAYSKGARGWHDPESFPEYTRLVAALLAKMERDPRVEDLKIDHG